MKNTDFDVLELFYTFVTFITKVSQLNLRIK